MGINKPLIRIPMKQPVAQLLLVVLFDPQKNPGWYGQNEVSFSVGGWNHRN